MESLRLPKKLIGLDRLNEIIFEITQNVFGSLNNISEEIFRNYELIYAYDKEHNIQISFDFKRNVFIFQQFGYGFDNGVNKMIRFDKDNLSGFKLKLKEFLYQFHIYQTLIS